MAVDINQLSNMFGSYVKNVDPAKYGGYTDAYWADALRSRNPTYADKNIILDFGGDTGVSYGPDSYGAKPYNDTELGTKAPVGAWVYTKEGTPEKFTGSWNRDSDQNPESYGWEFVSAFDPNTINLKDVDAKYRTANPGFDINANGFGISNAEYAALRPEEVFLDPLKAGQGWYIDPNGRESSSVLTRAGYLPDKGGYAYGPTNWFEGIAQEHASWAPMLMGAAMGGIGLAALPATTGMSLGAAAAANAPAWVPAAVMGAVGQGAATGQKTNDPWAIFGGAASGAVGGALSGGALAGLGGLTSAAGGEVGDLAFNMGANDAISQGIAKGTEAALNSGANTLLRQGASGNFDLGGVGTSMLSGAVNTGIDAAKGFVGDTVKGLFGTSPDFTSYSNNLADQYMNGGIVNNTIDSFTPQSYWDSANPNLSQVTGQFLNNTASASPFTDNYQGSLLNYDPNADPFKENFANATDGMSLLGDGNKLAVDETLEDPIKYKEKEAAKKKATDKKSTTTSPVTQSTPVTSSKTSAIATPYDASHKWWGMPELASQKEILEAMATGGLRDEDMSDLLNKLNLDATWYA